MPILVIEDEFLVAAEIRFDLQRGGFAAVEHVASEREALAVIPARNWDAAVVDANLNGLTIDRIAAELAQRNIPFVIVTGCSRSVLPKSVEDIPVINKPFHPDALVGMVSHLMRRQGN